MGMRNWNPWQEDGQKQPLHYDTNEMPNAEIRVDAQISYLFNFIFLWYGACL